MTISDKLPGGNIKVISVNGFEIVLEEDQRDSYREWFYWKFKAEFAEKGTYNFRFTRPNKVGPRSAAVSTDKGLSWSWMSQTHYADTQNFTFECSAPGEYWFCQCIPYMQSDFERFAAQYKDHPAFSVGKFARTRNGRELEIVRVMEGKPKHAVLLTARHHAQESMANYAQEGFISAVLADTPFGKTFRKNYALFVIPFVDKDGVEDGDQGKGRIPRDHARDYEGDHTYPEIADIKELIQEIEPFFILDMHCPWIRFGSNEYSYMTGGPDANVNIAVEKFADLLEKEAPACAPFYTRDILGFGVDWNVRANALTGPKAGYGLKGFCATANLKKTRFVHTIEIPFANFREQTVTPDTIRRLGAGLACAVRKRHLQVQAEDRKKDQPKEAVLAFAGAIAPETDKAWLREQKKVLSQADYGIGWLSEIYGPESDCAYLKKLAKAGFDMVSTATPHALDKGYEGLYQNLYKLDAAGLAHTGTGRSPEELEKTILKDICGIRVAFIGCTGELEKCHDPEVPAHALNTYPVKGKYKDLEQHIRNAEKSGADYIVVLADFGKCSAKKADTVARKIVNLGVDMVVCSDPAAMSAGDSGAVLVRLRKENGRTFPV